MSYLASLNPLNLLGAMPGNVAQGLIWGLMALGVYITFRLLDFADLTVDGSFATGGAVTVVLILHGWSVPAALLIAILAGLAAGLITGLLHTLLGIPPILAGILTQIALYSINLNIMGMANLAVSVDQYPLLPEDHRFHPYRLGAHRHCDHGTLLVLRHRTGQRHPCHWLQSGYE